MRIALVIDRIPTEETRMAIDLKNLNHTQLDDLIRRAQQRQEELRKEKTAKLREKFSALAKAEGLSLDDLVGRGGNRGARRKVKPKYRNPADRSQTWTGRGKRPRWFNAALAAGKKEKDLLI
jgi:DNA-binding protein H-NS